jgi:hypothetical protein
MNDVYLSGYRRATSILKREGPVYSSFQMKLRGKNL